MTLQEFINKYIGKKLDFDGSYGNQCVDLYRFYVKEVWQKPQTPGVIGAYQILDRLPAGYDKFRVGQGIPQPGDVITWNQNLVLNGHVAVVVIANSQTFDAFQQNAPTTGAAANIGRYTYRNVIGWFRPHSSLKKDDMLRTYNGTIYALVAGYWMAIGTTYADFIQDFGGQIAPPMTEAQFKAFPLHKRTIK
jgi:hypothetical protein